MFLLKQLRATEAISMMEDNFHCNSLSIFLLQKGVIHLRQIEPQAEESTKVDYTSKANRARFTTILNNHENTNQTYFYNTQVQIKDTCSFNV